MVNVQNNQMKTDDRVIAKNIKNPMKTLKKILEKPTLGEKKQNLDNKRKRLDMLSRLDFIK